MAFDKLQEEKGIPLADFLQAFHETPFEYINGKRILWMPSLAGHTAMIRAIFRILEAFILEHNLGEVFSEATFIEEYHKDWVKGSFTPDILFFAGERFANYKEENSDWEDKPFVLVPDIVIEVVSKNDSYSEINQKVLAYLDLAVKEIWLIDPHTKNAFVHSRKKTLMLNQEATISGGELLPNFELLLSQLFNKADK